MVLSAIIVCVALSGALAQDICGEKPDQPPWIPPETPDAQIVNGREAAPGSWPWQLSLQFLREDTEDDFRHTCGAVLVHKWFALTAAHCVEGRMVGVNDSRREDPENFRLLVGAHLQSDLTGVRVHYIDLIVKHERWVPDVLIGYPNDIALLRFTESVDLDNDMVRSCLPEDTFMDFMGSDCWISGWGLTHWQNPGIPDALHEAKFDLITTQECSELNFGYIRESHICAGTGAAGEPNACSGDSGGPMHCEKDGKWYLAGITSWGIAFCEGMPGVYTRVSYFWEWITLNMALYNPENL